MARVSLILVAALALPVTLSGCASTDGKFPSLAIRDAERVKGNAMPAEPAPPPPPAPVSADAGQRIAQALAQAREAHAAFTAGIGSATSAVAAARGSGPPADAWVSAQVALAALQSERSRAVIAQADLDLMYAQERLAEPGRTTPTADALAEARARIDGWVDEQNRAIARLASQLKS